MSQWTAADLPSFAGRTVIVTGANSGLGEVTARELARVGAKVILAVRNTAKGDEAAAGMTGDVEVRRGGAYGWPDCYAERGVFRGDPELRDRRDYQQAVAVTVQQRTDPRDRKRVDDDDTRSAAEPTGHQ